MVQKLWLVMLPMTIFFSGHTNYFPFVHTDRKENEKIGERHTGSRERARRERKLGVVRDTTMFSALKFPRQCPLIFLVGGEACVRN
jgi:hypothetical protein